MKISQSLIPRIIKNKLKINQGNIRNFQVAVNK